MRVLLSWLRELVDVPTDAAQVAARLTMAGLEVEGLERLDKGLENVVVGEVQAKEPIAGTKLNVCRVFDGQNTLQIVCGAQNYGVGAHVPLARVGAVLPGNKAIGQAKLRGVESFGMLCSGRELGLEDGVDGLLLLAPETVPGTPIADVIGRSDVAFEINVTPNRGDALSHLGVARDLAALYRLPLKRWASRLPSEEVGSAAANETTAAGPALARVTIAAADRCSRFALRTLQGVVVGPSPTWLSRRIEALGQRSINNIVDATNLVMFELGQPMHAYDLDRIEGAHLTVRCAREGETLRTLDGQDRVLAADDLVIADDARPVGLAGVMGGEDSEVKSATTRVLLESASFSPQTVRQTARRYGLHSEASHRFERGVDPEGTRDALDALTEVILSVAGGVTVGNAVDLVARPYDRARIPLRRARIDALLGAPVPWGEATAILIGLGLTQLHTTDEEAEFEIPGYRSDLTMETDLIEEVARIRGYESIPPRVLGGAGTEAHEEQSFATEKRVRIALSAGGFDETVNFAFAAPAELARLTPAVAPITIRNPLVQEQGAMRTTLLAGLLHNVAHNLRHGVTSVRLYESGRVYLPLETAPHGRLREPHFEIDREPRRLSLVTTGPRGRSWTGGHEALDFYDLKGAVEDVLDALGATTQATFTRRSSAVWLHPRSATELSIAGTPAGVMGELHPVVAEAFALPRGVFAAELDLDALIAHANLIPAFHGLPRFPASLRDVALVVDDRVTAAEIIAELHRADEQHLVEDATIFDVYKGEPLPAGKKNVAFSLRIRSADRTLKDEEVNTLHAAIVARLQSAFGAALRS